MLCFANTLLKLTPTSVLSVICRDGLMTANSAGHLLQPGLGHIVALTCCSSADILLIQGFCHCQCSLSCLALLISTGHCIQHIHQANSADVRWRELWSSPTPLLQLLPSNVADALHLCARSSHMKLPAQDSCISCLASSPISTQTLTQSAA